MCTTTIIETVVVDTQFHKVNWLGELAMKRRKEVRKVRISMGRKRVRKQENVRGHSSLHYLQLMIVVARLHLDTPWCNRRFCTYEIRPVLLLLSPKRWPQQQQKRFLWRHALRSGCSTTAVLPQRDGQPDSSFSQSRSKSKRQKTPRGPQKTSALKTIRGSKPPK